MKRKIFIDGQAGTTGLKLAKRLSERSDIEFIIIEEEKRKDISARLACIEAADVAFLCLPDKDALEIALAAGPEMNTRIIDCSTAHRIAEGWIYGMPEIQNVDGASKRVSNPGCYPTGFIMSVRPLVEAGIIDPEAELSVHAMSGYSGGGKAMIAEYEAHTQNQNEPYTAIAPRMYGLSQQHKHIPEMQKYTGLKTAPLFSPIVCSYYCGMLVAVPLPRSAFRRICKMETVQTELANYYAKSPLVKVRELGEELSEKSGAGLLAADAFANRDDIELFVTGKDDKISLVSRYDNLGKGASGAAIQNLNKIIGVPEETGLVIGR